MSSFNHLNFDTARHAVAVGLGNRTMSCNAFASMATEVGPEYGGPAAYPVYIDSLGLSQPQGLKSSYVVKAGTPLSPEAAADVTDYESLKDHLRTVVPELLDGTRNNAAYQSAFAQAMSTSGLEEHASSMVIDGLRDGLAYQLEIESPERVH